MTGDAAGGGELNRHFWIGQSFEVKPVIAIPRDRFHEVSGGQPPGGIAYQLSLSSSSRPAKPLLFSRDEIGSVAPHRDMSSGWWSRFGCTV